MKNNLVKILATLGLIVAIALILKGVFGVGKIGLKKVSKNNTIIFDQCWDRDNFTNFIDFTNENDGFNEKYTFELDFEKKTMVSILVRKDSEIKREKELGRSLAKISLTEYPIIAASNNFVETDLVGDLIRYNYVFDLKKGQVIQKAESSIYQTNFQCDKF